MYVIGDLSTESFAHLCLDEYLQNPRIRFLDRVNDLELVEYYSNAIGFIYPSLYEGFGLPPLEAQKCGCPVLCSDIPVLHEVCRDSVLYCNPYDIDDMAEKLGQIDSKRGELQEKGYKNVTRFSWENSCQKLCNIMTSTQQMHNMSQLRKLLISRASKEKKNKL